MNRKNHNPYLIYLLAILIIILAGSCASHKYIDRKKPCDCPTIKNNPRVKGHSEILNRKQNFYFYSIPLKAKIQNSEAA